MRLSARENEVVVHASAIVHRDAVLAAGVRVGPHCIIEDGVTIGEGTVLEAGAQVLRGTTLGARNHLGAYVILGGPPMDLKFRGEESFLEVGDGNRIREFSTIHRATGAGEVTRVGNDNFIMAYVHITHNCVVGNRNIIPNAAQVAGHVVIEDDVTFGGTVGVHQFCRIGSYAMVGMNSKVTRDVLPYSLADGHPARHFTLNAVGLRRRDIGSEERGWLGEVLHAIRNGESLDPFSAWAERSRHVAHLIAFASAKSKRGLSSFASRQHAG
jgi:UDP-N-acetylglucosamine acyltransferase